MTADEKIKCANRYRIRTGVSSIGWVPKALVSKDEDGWNGDFLVPLEGEIWHVRLSDGMGWRHLSVTNGQRPRMMANWNVMRRLKNIFFPDDAWVVEFHPPATENINDHPYCLHLWEPLDEALPIPLSAMV